MKINLKSPWTISIGTAIFSFGLTILSDLAKSKPILSTLESIFSWIINLLTKFLNYEIKVWWILLSIAIVIIVIVLFLFAASKSESTKPDFIDYTQDYIHGYTWSWDWKWDDYKKVWVIDNIKAHCSKCSTPMIEHPTYFEHYFECPRCNFRTRDGQVTELYKIESIVIDNLDRKRKTVPNKL